MRNQCWSKGLVVILMSIFGLTFAFHARPAAAQHTAASAGDTQRDPAEPAQGKPRTKILQRPGGAVARQSVDEKSMRALIEKLVGCGTRLTLSSWIDPKRGAGCGRDQIVARFNEIAKDSGGKLQVVVDKFEMTAERTAGKPVPLENVYAIVPGTDPKLAKTVFLVSGHFDSRPSNVMDPDSDAPGADDDGSGVAVSVESARLLSKASANGKGYRATLLFAAVSGEEQGLLGSTHLLDWLKQQGYTVGGMLDDDIVGADPAPGAPHRVRLFSGNGEIEDCDSPSRELGRAVQGGIARRALYGAAGELQSSAPNASHGKRCGIWRFREVSELCVYGKCGARQCRGVAAIGAGSRCAHRHEACGCGCSGCEGILVGGRRSRTGWV